MTASEPIHNPVFELDFMKNPLNFSILETAKTLKQEVKCRMVLVVNFFVLFYLFFCFVVAISNLVQYVETIFHLTLAATSIWKSFLK